MTHLSFPRLPPEGTVPAAKLNEYRAARWKKLLRAYDEALNNDAAPDECFDLTHCACVMADMLHWCAANDIAVEDVMRLAQTHFDAEQTEEVV